MSVNLVPCHFLLKPLKLPGHWFYTQWSKGANIYWTKSSLWLSLKDKNKIIHFQVFNICPNEIIAKTKQKQKENKQNKKKNSIYCQFLHEYFIFLISEWRCWISVIEIIILIKCDEIIQFLHKMHIITKKHINRKHSLQETHKHESLGVKLLELGFLN